MAVARPSRSGGQYACRLTMMTLQATTPASITADPSTKNASLGPGSASAVNRPNGEVASWMVSSARAVPRRRASRPASRPASTPPRPPRDTSQPSVPEPAPTVRTRKTTWTACRPAIARLTAAPKAVTARTHGSPATKRRPAGISRLSRRGPLTRRSPPGRMAVRQSDDTRTPRRPAGPDADRDPGGQPAESGASDPGALLPGLQFRVAIHQVRRGDQRGRVRRVGGGEEDGGGPRQQGPRGPARWSGPPATRRPARWRTAPRTPRCTRASPGAARDGRPTLRRADR